MTASYLDQRIRIRQLKVVVAIAEHGSLLKASLALGISQPALTKSLQDVEEILGVRIFDRLPRGVVPNQYGEVVLARASRVLAEISRLDEDLAQVAGALAGSIALGALPTAASGLIPGSLTRLRATHPGLGVRVVQGRTNELLPALAAGDLDLVVGRLYEPPAPDDFRREPLYAEPISVLARSAHPIFAREAVSGRDLADFDMALPSTAQRMGREVEAALMALDLPPPTTAVRSTSLSLIRELVHGSDVLTVLPRMMLTGDLVRGSVRAVPIEIPTPPRRAGLIFLRHRPPTPGVEALVTAIKAYVAELHRTGVLQ